MLDGRVGPLTANHSLGIEYGVGGVGGQLILGSISDETFTVIGEGYVRWGDTVSLVVGDNLNTSVLEHSDTEIEMVIEH